jgi:type II pantothenate kinase
MLPLWLCRLVNIGSGVSIVEVRTRRDFRRVSGSSLGGAAFFSLCQLLTEYKSYQEILDGSQMGDLTKVDMLVRPLLPTAVGRREGSCGSSSASIERGSSSKPVASAVRNP